MNDEVAKVVLAANSKPVFTDHVTVDVRTALTRGLADYLGSVVINAPGGRQIRFAQVFSTWAEPETPAKYPAAIVYAPIAGVYDSSKFTPSVSGRARIGATNMYLVSHAEFGLDMTVEIWATDPRERMELVGNLESLFNPTLFMYGFKLDLPYYFGERATYELRSSQYHDSEQEAMQHYRRATFVVHGDVPVVQVFELPEARPRFRLDAIGESVVVESGIGIVLDP